MGEVKNVETRYCCKCGSKVIKSKLLKEYSYQCLECNQDLFGFETYRKK